MSDLDVHCYPCGPNSDHIEHRPDQGPFYTGNFMKGCWACQNDVCFQRVTYENPITGAKDQEQDPDWPDLCTRVNCDSAASFRICGRQAGTMYLCTECFAEVAQYMVDMRRRQTELVASGCHSLIASRRVLNDFDRLLEPFG